MEQRGITHDYVYWAWKKPDKQQYQKKNQSYKYYRKNKHNWFVVVAKQNEQKEWVMMTCWWKPIKSVGTGFKHSVGTGLKPVPTKSVGFWQNLWRMLVGK